MTEIAPIILAGLVGIAIPLLLVGISSLINQKIKRKCKRLLEEKKNKEAKEYLLRAGFDDDAAFFFLQRINNKLKEQERANLTAITH